MEAPGSASDERDAACDKRLRSPGGRRLLLEVLSASVSGLDPGSTGLWAGSQC